MTGRRILPGLAALALFTACRDTTPPTAPGESTTAVHRVAAPAADRPRLERLARRMARALADPAFRARLRADLDRSLITEHKLHFQRFLTAGSNSPLTEVARLNGESDHALRAEVLGATALELYLPVPEHRARWTGGAEVLVATAIHDREAPVAYDVQGRMIRLSADAPPDTPVIALVPAETNFDVALPSRVREAAVVCPYGGRVSAQCGGGGGGAGTSPGLWMTYSSFTQTFEGWLKGSPEFEIHILGQAGATDSLTSYQCAGEHAGGPYAFDQNSLTWTGNVLLFSQAQIDAYKQQHPGQSMRVFALEDDDTACHIKLDADRVGSMFRLIDSHYNLLTGGRDTTAGTTLIRYWNRATAFQKVFRAVWSAIVTKDEVIGTAIQDAIAGEFKSGANWIVKGENLVTYGALKLVMR